MINHCFDLFIHSVESQRHLPLSFSSVYLYPFLLQNKATEMKDVWTVAARMCLQLTKEGEKRI